MTSTPHNLALDSQPHFGLAQSDFLNLNNILINVLKPSGGLLATDRSKAMVLVRFLLNIFEAGF